MSETKEETPFERFQKVVKKVMSVPKKEIDKRERKLKRAKRAKI
jgi:hypothetical protein